MIPRLYKHNETKFNHNGEGLLKDIIKCRVVHERNGQYDLELEYKSKSRLSDKIIKGNLIKADAGKRFKNQLFRVYNIKKSLNNTIIAYANHISFDLRNNFIPIVNLKNVSCMTALNTMAKSMALENSFIFETDITHSADFTVERVDVLSALGGIRGSIIDTFGNGANIVRDNFKISILQNVGYDNNILISYKKNLLDLNFEDGKEVITGIYPYVQFSEGINSETQINKEILELPEKYLYIEGHENAKVKKVIGVDFSENKDINTIDKLREAGNKYLKNLVKDMPSIKVKFVDKENLNEFENVSQLQTLDLYDTVIVRYISLGINYKTKINKVVYDVLKEEYEEIELGEKRTNLASSLNDTDKNIKDEIKNNIDFVKQVIEHATSQITGNSGGHVMLWPPDKPSEIFFMDTDNPNTARNVLRINREGIGFSNNGINGPFRTAWTSEGTFYADFITAGILTAIMIQNRDGSLQIDLSGTDGVKFLKHGIKAIEIAGNIMKFNDWDGIGDPIAEIFSSRLGGDENRPCLTIGNTKEGCISIGYRDENNPKTYPKYMLFDIHNLSGEAPYPIMLYENMCLNSRCLYLDQYDNKGIYSSATQNFILRSKKSFIFVDQNNKSIFEIDPINKKINIFNDAVYSYLPIGNKHNKIDNSSNNSNEMLLGGNYKTTIGAWNDSNSLDGKIEVSGNLIESFSHWDFNNWTLRNAYIESPRISIKENNSRTKSVLEKRIVETITPNTEYIGEGEVINGTCKIDLNLPIQGIGSQYYVQLTPIGKNKKVELIEKTNSYFIVEGDDCKFDYLLKVKHPKKPSRLKTRETKNNIIKAKEHKTSEFSREQTKLPYWILYTKNKIK